MRQFLLVSLAIMIVLWGSFWYSLDYFNRNVDTRGPTLKFSQEQLMALDIGLMQLSGIIIILVVFLLLDSLGERFLKKL